MKLWHKVLNMMIELEYDLYNVVVECFELYNLKI